jgi:hypothetical protein
VETLLWRRRRLEEGHAAPARPGAPPPRIIVDVPLNVRFI